jgi:DNA-cytosine methyltransferase
VSQRGFRDPRDSRNAMFWEFTRLIDTLKPRAFLMENVAGLTHRHNWPLLQELVRHLRSLGYTTGGDVVSAAEYGVPQLRHRFIMIGIRGSDAPVMFPKPTHAGQQSAAISGTSKRRLGGGLVPFVTLREAIGDLPSVSSGGGSDVASYGTAEANSAYQQEMRFGSDVLYNHRASNIASINLARIADIPEGGNWKDIPAGLLPPRFFECRLTDHSTTYARLRWDHPAFTLTALFGNVTAGAFTHPEQNRALTVREGARIHGFPDRFRFAGPLNSQYRQIGNAVPPRLARAFARQIAGWLDAGVFPEASVTPRLSDEFILSTDWNNVPVLTPRYSSLFGTGTRWPAGWGAEPKDRKSLLDNNYRLKEAPELLAAE